MMEIHAAAAAKLAESAAAAKLTAERFSRLPARPAWSAKRWLFIAKAGPIIFHRGAKKGVPSHRLAPIDTSKYRGDALRAIRRSALNFNGEMRR